MCSKELAQNLEVKHNQIPVEASMIQGTRLGTENRLIHRWAMASTWHQWSRIRIQRQGLKLAHIWRVPQIWREWNGWWTLHNIHPSLSSSTSVNTWRSSEGNNNTVRRSYCQTCSRALRLYQRRCKNIRKTLPKANRKGSQSRSHLRPLWSQPDNDWDYSEVIYNI